MSDAALAAARRRLLELKARFDAGDIDPARYASDRVGIEREVGDALLATESERAAARPSLRLVAGLAAAVVALAVFGYAKTGSPALAGIASVGRAAPVAAADEATSPPDVAASDSRQAAVQKIEAMVEGLATRMKSRPDDAEGWTMLARSYTVLGRFGEALPAYRRATELQPKNAGLLSDYADAIAATKGAVDNAESIALIERALAVDPNHPKALALAGTVAYDRGDFAGAIALWQKLADLVPPESELARQVQASIADARAHSGAPGSAAPSRSLPGTPVAAAPPATPSSPVAAIGAGTVSGTVTLAPDLASRAAPDDTVFVFARAAGGGRMPLAVQRARVADLPLRFKLDDSMAMTPTARLSGATSVIVGARISKSGNAIPQAGDLAGEAAPVAPGATGMSIRIGEVVGGR